MPVLQLNSGLGGVIQKWQVAIGNIGKSFWKKAKHAFIRQNAILLFIFLVVFCHKTKLPNKGKSYERVTISQNDSSIESSLLGKALQTREFTNTVSTG